MQFRVRLPSGKQEHIKTTLGGESTVKDLKSAVFQSGKTEAKSWRCLELRYVFPPPTVLSDDSSKLSALKVTSGNLIIAYIEPPPEPEPEAKSCHDTAIVNITDGKMIKKEIASDNSCLFNAVAYVCDAKDLSKSEELRSVIASIVLSDPETYSAALLGASSEDYCAYILKSDTWGGSIELSVLSTYYQTEIATVDVATLNLHVFGEGRGHWKRAYLIYDGIHYDACVMTPPPTVASLSATSTSSTVLLPSDESTHQTLFNPSDDGVYAMVFSIAMEAHDKKQYTDVHKFSLMCSECFAKLCGQTDAQEHAKRTGHLSFVEYTP